MSTEKTDYLRFSAYSLKELITRKLTSDTRFTDQIYEGSNINVLIDLVSYLYQCLVFQINNAASESMFSDTQIYENINRLVKMLGYNPKGIIPSSGTFYLNNIKYDGDIMEGGGYKGNVILPFSYVETSKTDSRGEKVCFSIDKEYTINSEENYSITLYNGKWKLYPKVFTASGSDYETFVTTDIGSDIEEERFAANNKIKIYVKNSSGEYETDWTVSDKELFTNNDFESTQYAYTIDSTSKCFNVRLNENKTYEIKFGNGVLGKRLNKGDQVYIFYLDTNGLDGQVTPDDIPESTMKFKHSKEDFGLTEDSYNAIFGASSIEKAITELSEDDQPYVYLNATTSEPQAEEGVDEIRQSAPEEFKLGRRLVTAYDYEYFVKNKWKGQVIDVKCQNNFEYTGTSFYIWLYTLGVEKHNNPAYYLNEITLVKYGFKYSDPADSNNVYLWTKLYLQDVENSQNRFKEEMQDVKDLTHEIVFLEPIEVQFSVCAAPEDKMIEYLTESDGIDKMNAENWIEITLDSNSIYVSSVIKNQVAQIIQEFFDLTKQKLGQSIDYSSLLKKLMAINGVSKIRTVYQPSEDDSEEHQIPIYKEGISFATWSSDYIDTGDDLEVSNSMRKLEDFQFPILFDTDIANKIKVIKKSLNASNNVQY